MRNMWLFALLISALAVVGAAAAPSHPVLRAHLLALAEEAGSRAETDAAAPLPAERNARHDERRAGLRSILKAHGWPGRDLVGEDGSQAAVAILQAECADCDLLKLAIPLLQAAVQLRVATLSDLARLIDADRVGQGRMQVYGTQYRAALDGRPVRFPVEDLEHVDVRRRLAGLPSLRSQEEDMGLLGPRPTVEGHRPAETKPYWRTRLQTAPGLNWVRYPRLRMIYVHSRDDPRAPDGERYALPGLDIKTLPIPSNRR